MICFRKSTLELRAHKTNIFSKTTQSAHIVSWFIRSPNIYWIIHLLQIILKQCISNILQCLDLENCECGADKINIFPEPHNQCTSRISIYWVLLNLLNYTFPATLYDIFFRANSTPLRFVSDCLSIWQHIHTHTWRNSTWIYWTQVVRHYCVVLALLNRTPPNLFFCAHTIAL